jgi:hypothetical protein
MGEIVKDEKGMKGSQDRSERIGRLKMRRRGGR